ncbi:hypothetical protein Ddye_013912 [Dipteronia dyeriana]|uniref:Arabinogalactan peptide, AGP n=1 Tax=Dipteronia dyeriana TaxID=168575 RepID=A0AAE0CK41_9ROSI|nr:hypothetical protein Ddye_013912 [Dipteronia dyeriana]
MAVSTVCSFNVFTIIAFIYTAVLPQGQSAAPAPSPTNDGTSIDQGIAYFLMVVALVLTYLIH